MTLGSGVPEPVAVCDIAVPLRLLSNAVDRIAIAEGATKPDDDLMPYPPEPRRTLPPRCVCDTMQTSPNYRIGPLRLAVYFRRRRRHINQENADRSLEALRCLLLALFGHDDPAVGCALKGEPDV